MSKKMEKSTAVVFLDVRKIDIVDKEKDAWMKFVFKWKSNAGSQNGKPRGNVAKSASTGQPSLASVPIGHVSHDVC